MAGVVSSAVAEEMVKKLIFTVSQDSLLAWNVQGVLKKLQGSLTVIQYFLRDAQRQQLHSSEVRSWLKRLKDVAYDADDLLDEFEYEALCCNMEIQNTQDSIENEVRDTSSFSNPIAFSFEMACKLKDINGILYGLIRDAVSSSVQLQIEPISGVGVGGRESGYVSADTTNLGGTGKMALNAVKSTLGGLRSGSGDIWDNSGVSAELKLRYDRLPSPVKQCFAYCSILPKDSTHEKDTVIKLWMAEGFLEVAAASGSKLMEDIGDEYFNTLVSNSKFEVERRDNYGDVRYFRIDGSVHDLVKLVAGKECSTVKDKEGSSMEGVSEIRRLSDEIKTGPTSLHEAKKLWTVRSTDVSSLLCFNCLRVLDLRGIVVNEMPSSIGNLKHLRKEEMGSNN
ncbi:PREDICTED: putative disease resistance protein RGA4 [Nelumbo nucifera]|uniref:Disease resistance protein RGA4 n=1 Tax=Nelumbo nucifera TaxID=4432 RepID=A0A1U8PY44_NELNU|nr:PREDICTED: putative disease resistance protein RGA4 [Nelumbo nucifera]